MAMSGRKLLFLSGLVVLLLSALTPSASAVTIPQFPACANPQGSVTASYDSGTHGVAGDQTTYSGKDTVYTLSENTLTQCLCPANGNGIQTNWWKATELSQEEKDVLVSQGWILIPDGSAWGLETGAYLAKNSSYTCSGVGGASATNTSTSGPTGETSSINTILNLASTGNIRFILLTIVSGAVLLSLGLIPNLKKKNKI